ncbi:MAG: pilus assembly PilX N-terminal domain-containing protein [Candidatus Saccharibacteria bacterium]
MIKTTLRSNEKGFAALVVAMTLIFVLSLLTIGFAQIIRNESRQALNRQLSSQAYYAAEAGINDAVRAINVGGYSKHKTTCGPITAPADASDKYLMDNIVNAAANSKWTCLLIDTAPTSVDYGSIDTVTPTVFTVTGVDAATGTTPVAINSITVAWQDADSSLTTFRPASGVTNNSFAPIASWGAPGVLRLAVTPFTAIDRSTLVNDTFTAFLYPNNSASPGSPGTTNYTNNQTQSGPIVNGNCHTANATTYARFCVVKISFPVPEPAGTNFLFNLRSIYSNTNAHITANGGAARLVGAQTVIDSTGQSQDVLKRIQVRVPANDSQLYPGFGLDSLMGICKNLSAYPGYASGCSL